MYWMTSEELEEDSETRTRSQRNNGNKDVQQLGEKVLGDHVGAHDQRGTGFFYTSDDSIVCDAQRLSSPACEGWRSQP